MKTLHVRTLHEWRRWLTKHHASVPELWLVFYKQHTGVASIDYKDALDEALCFGWVDSLVKRLDDRRFARKFTPRRADSRWSEVNRKRYGELKAAGRLKPPSQSPAFCFSAANVCIVAINFCTVWKSARPMAA